MNKTELDTELDIILSKPTPKPLQQIMEIGNFRDQLIVGRRFRYVGFYSDGKKKSLYCPSRWCVNRVVDRGIVVSHPIPGDPTQDGGHQHLIEWNEKIYFFEIIG